MSYGATSTSRCTRGEFAAILGPNGSGKTTLLRVLLGELPLARGEARVLGGARGAQNGSIGYLPQRRHFDVATPIRGVDLVRLGLDGARWGLPLRRARAERVEQVLDLVGARAYADRPIGALSGGEQQRLLIAQALVSGPPPADSRRAARQPRPTQPASGRRPARASLSRGAA